MSGFEAIGVCVGIGVIVAAILIAVLGKRDKKSTAYSSGAKKAVMKRNDQYDIPTEPAKKNDNR